MKIRISYGLVFLAWFLVLFGTGGCSLGKNLRDSPPEPVAGITEKTEIRLELFEGEIYSLFVHPLIVIPERAFYGQSKNFMDQWFVTVDEFQSLLNELYARNYILVKVSDIYEFDQQTSIMKKRDLHLPAGKYPVLFSADDLNYYDTMKLNGTNIRLVLDQLGRVAAEYKDKNGEMQISRTSEFIGILEDFTEEHPDFSWNGAKGLIAVTGFNGVFGYPTHNSADSFYAQGMETAKAIAEILKTNGWEFGSHGYAHLDADMVNEDKLKRDCDLWAKTVESIVGNTEIYVYPKGSEPHSRPENFQVLKKAGFRSFFGVGLGVYNRWYKDYLLIRRREIDGVYFCSDDVKLSPFFDVTAVSRRSQFLNK